MYDLTSLQNSLCSVDITRLIEYTNKINDIGSLNNAMAPVYLRDFIMAYDMTNMMLAIAIKVEIQANSALENMEAVAYMDRAGDYLKSKDIKDTADARKRYVDIDEDVCKAKDILAQATAMSAFLKNKMQSFRCAHDTLKKIVYGDNYQTPYEGMK